MVRFGRANVLAVTWVVYKLDSWANFGCEFGEARKLNIAAADPEVSVLDRKFLKKVRPGRIC
jgi:hypothetical protein